MKNTEKDFIIPFIGLKLGVHRFEFEIEDSFFGELEYSLIHAGKLKASLELEKKETMMIAHFQVAGSVSTDCDRCNTPMDLNLSGSFTMIYKFGLEESDDENLIVLHPDEYQINVKDPIYELLTISLPPRKVHPIGECDEEMWNLLQTYTLNAGVEEEDDSDWDDEDWDDEDDFDDDDEDFDDDDFEDESDDDAPIDPKWAALKGLASENNDKVN